MDQLAQPVTIDNIWLRDYPGYFQSLRVTFLSDHALRFNHLLNLGQISSKTNAWYQILGGSLGYGYNPHTDRELSQTALKLSREAHQQALNVSEDGAKAALKLATEAERKASNYRDEKSNAIFLMSSSDLLWLNTTLQKVDPHKLAQQVASPLTPPERAHAALESRFKMLAECEAELSQAQQTGKAVTKSLRSPPVEERGLGRLTAFTEREMHDIQNRELRLRREHLVSLRHSRLQPASP